MMHRFVIPMLLASLALTGCSVFSSDDPAPGTAGTPSESPSESASSEPTGKPVTAEFFGLHDHDPVGDAPAGWPQTKFGSYRAWDAAVTWREIELAPGQFSFDRLDAMVDTAESHDTGVLLVLGQTPAFHAKQPTAESFYGEGAASPPKLKAWKTYVRTVAERYAGRNVEYQVWNEPNVSGFWSGSPQAMANLTKATYDVLSEIDPKPLLAAPALVTRLSGQRSWINRYYGSTVDGQPVSDFFDVVSFQLYPAAEGTPETSMELLVAMREMLATYGVDKPIWNSEINYGLTGVEVEPTGAKQQQANVAQTYILNAANGIERVYWYGWDQQLIVDTLLTEVDGATTTAAGEAFKTVRKWLTGATVSCSQDAQGTYACTLNGPAGQQTVFWNPDGDARVTVPEGADQAQEVGSKAQPASAGSTLDVGILPVLVDAVG